MNKRKKKIFKKRENPKSSKFPQHRKWIAIDHEKNTQNGRKRVPMKEQGSKWGRRNIREMGGFGGFKGRLWRAKISLDALNFVTQHTLANKISKCRKIYQFLSMLVNLVDIVHEILCSREIFLLTMVNQILILIFTAFPFIAKQIIERFRI